LGLPCSVCRSAAEWLEHPHARASGTVVEVQDPEYGRMLQPGTPVRLYGADARGPSPRRPLDADHDAVVAESAARTPAAPPADVPLTSPRSGGLAGLRVLDLTQVL